MPKTTQLSKADYSPTDGGYRVSSYAEELIYWIMRLS